MTPKLTNELAKLTDAHPGESVLVEHPQTHAIYFVIDEETHRKAMRALQEQEDWESIQRGLKDRKEGNELPLAEADVKIRKELGFPPRS